MTKEANPMPKSTHSIRILFILVSLYIVFIAFFLLNYSLPNYLAGINFCFTQSQSADLCQYKVQSKLKEAKHSISVITDQQDFMKMFSDLESYQGRGVNVRVILNTKNNISEKLVDMAHHSKTNIKGSSSADIHSMIIIDSKYVIVSKPFENKNYGVPFNNAYISPYILNGSALVKPYVHYFHGEWSQSDFIIDNHLSFLEKIGRCSVNLLTYLITPQAGFLLIAFLILSIVSAALIQAYRSTEKFQLNGLLRVIVILQNIYIILFCCSVSFLFAIALFLNPM